LLYGAAVTMNMAAAESLAVDAAPRSQERGSPGSGAQTFRTCPALVVHGIR